MKSIECNSCNTKVVENATFCHSCGARIRCKSCSVTLVKNAKFCTNCGAHVDTNNFEKQADVNTVNYHWTKDEIKCDVSLTNEVGKEGINALIQNITSHQTFSSGKVNELRSLPVISSLEKEDDLSNFIEIENKTNNLEKGELSHNFPPIQDLEISINCTESDWILIYAYYESGFAKKSFTQNAVREKYMKSRKTVTRSKNFGANWKKAFKSFFATINDNQLKFKTDNLSYIHNLIDGSVGSISKTSNKKNKHEITDRLQNGTKKRNSNIQSYSLETNLNLNPANTHSLRDFYSLYSPKGAPETILTIVYYLERIIDQQNIGENTIYTCYKALGLRVPNIGTALNNIKTRQGYVDTSNRSNLKITITGENHIEHGMGKTNDFK